MEITKLEKWALGTTGAAAAYKTLLWSLEATVNSSDTPYTILRILFAALSFVAFDLVIGAVVLRGWSISGVPALLVASAASGAIGLQVSKVVIAPALHAAPAVVLAAFGLHLMWCCRPIMQPAPVASTVNNTQINVGMLPRTFAQFAAARAAEMPDATPAQIAAELGTSQQSFERLIERAAITTMQED